MNRRLQLCQDIIPTISKKKIGKFLIEITWSQIFSKSGAVSYVVQIQNSQIARMLCFHAVKNNSKTTRLVINNSDAMKIFF